LSLSLGFELDRESIMELPMEVIIMDMVYAQIDDTATARATVQ
jgi:hypothetical protein